MTISKDKLVTNGLIEYPKRVIVKSAKIVLSSMKWMFRYSCLEFIYRKFKPLKNPHPLPTGFIWLIGIYVAFFGVASQRYENRVDIIENRANAIFAQLAVPDVREKALSRISTVQDMWCPEKPEIIKPLTVFRSLVKYRRYDEMVRLLRDTLQDWKDHLGSVTLNNADLRRTSLAYAKLSYATLTDADLSHAYLAVADLSHAYLVSADFKDAFLGRANLEDAYFLYTNLQGANLREAKLRNARELTIDRLCKAKTLYKAELDPELERQVKEKCPHLLDEPKAP